MSLGEVFYQWTSRPSEHPGTLGRMFADATGFQDHMTLPMSNVARMTERMISAPLGLIVASDAGWRMFNTPTSMAEVFTSAVLIIASAKTGAVLVGKTVDYVLDLPKP